MHLELVDSLNTFDALLAMRRFMSRRGLPTVVYSDNAKTFKSLKGKMLSLLGHTCPKWKFIAPRSPWWGGFWERMVKSVKSATRKTVGSSFLTRSELETTLHEVELCINSRPLTFVSDEVDSAKPLTPAHFLMERPFGVADGNFGESDVPIVSAYSFKDKHDVKKGLLEHFWHLWQFEYIKELPKSQGSSTDHTLGVGSVVLMREQGLPKLQWPLAIVTKVFTGKDGIIRSVQLKTSKGLLCRSIQLLHDLEIACSSDYSSVSSDLEPVADDESIQIR